MLRYTLTVTLGLAALGGAFAQNTTTAGELIVEPQVTAPGSILSRETPVDEIEPNDDAADRPVPAGLAPVASTPRDVRENELFIATPVEPLGRTRPDYSELDHPTPLGAHDNGYRPGSSAGYYDVTDDRHKPVAPTIKQEPAPVPDAPNVAPQGFNRYDGPDRQ